MFSRILGADRQKQTQCWW